MRYHIILLFFLLPLYGQAQKQGNIWYFGHNAGLDFNAGTPVPLLDGQLNIWEGCATIADNNGNLLFYTDGIRVWNRNHQIMPNGTGLMGDNSATQSGVIVPYPGNPDLYYIFTVDLEAGAKGLRYSLVDITLEGGLGDVTSKNIPLLSSSTEKITAVHHQNKKDIWVIAHAWNSDAFYVWLVNETGIAVAPNVTNIGSVHSGNPINSIGYLKASPDGSKIALAAYFQAKFVEVFDFDNAAGTISNPIKLAGFSFFAIGPYGVEFSPNGKLLYIAEAQGLTNLYQFDLSSSNSATIASSRKTLSSDLNFGALQLATDGKIYLARDESPYLGVINSPNNIGAASGFVLNGLLLGGRSSRLGLPTFIQSFFLPSDFTYVDTCYGETTTFFSHIDNADAVLTWNFGDPASGDQNTSDALNPSHTFTSSGPFTVTLTATVEGTPPATVSKTINIVDPPSIDLGNDTTLCEGEILVLEIGQAGSTYLWSDSTTTPSYTIDKSGTYWAEANNGVCVARDSVVVAYITPASFTIGNDTSLCRGDSLLLQAPAGMDTYLWQEGSTASSLWATQAGTYAVTVSLGACKASDSIAIDYFPDPKANLGDDRTICAGETVLLDVFDDNAGGYLWQDGSTNSEFKVDTSGIYRVSVDNLCNTNAFTDSIEVTVKNVDTPNITDTLLCGPGSANLQAIGQAEVFKWYASANDTIILHQSEEGIFVTPQLNTSTPFWVSAVNGECESNRVMATVLVDLTSAQAGSDTTIQAGETLQLQASGGNTYQWSPPRWLSDNTIADPVATPPEDITYTVAVTSHTGCVFEDDISIIVIPVENDLIIPNTITPNGDGINENWIITNIEHYPENRVRIFDRTGRQLLEFNNYQQSWDGTVHGNPLPGDTYFYVIDRSNNALPLKGFITIIR